MLLRKVVSAILIDLVTAQDLSNEYASQISRKYKQYRNSKENILNNFDAPASFLKEMELELKFAFTDLFDAGLGLDVEETWGNCRNLAEECLKNAIPKMQSLIGQVIPQIPGLLQPQQPPVRIDASPETPQTDQTKEIETIQEIWIKVRDNLKQDEYFESVKEQITQKLFKTSKALFLRGNESIDIKIVKQIIQDQLEEGVLKHPDIQYAITTSQEIVSKVGRSANIANFVENNSRDIFIETANTQVKERDVRKLIQKFPDIVPHAEIMMSPSFLRELPVETLSSLTMTVKMDSYKWTITEGGEGLNKAKN